MLFGWYGYYEIASSRKWLNLHVSIYIFCIFSLPWLVSDDWSYTLFSEGHGLAIYSTLSELKVAQRQYIHSSEFSSESFMEFIIKLLYQ
jgi:hypothetical protein